MICVLQRSRGTLPVEYGAAIHRIERRVHNLGVDLTRNFAMLRHEGLLRDPSVDLPMACSHRAPSDCGVASSNAQVRVSEGSPDTARDNRQQGEQERDLTVMIARPDHQGMCTSANPT